MLKLKSKKVNFCAGNGKLILFCGKNAPKMNHEDARQDRGTINLEASMPTTLLMGPTINN